MKLGFSYTMRVGGKVVCTASSTNCFIENGRPVALSERFPQLYEAIKSTVELL